MSFQFAGMSWRLYPTTLKGRPSTTRSKESHRFSPRYSRNGGVVSLKLAQMPRNGAAVRVRLRCALTGRSRGKYRKFKLCRIKLRSLANEGQIPGMVKASW